MQSLEQAKVLFYSWRLIEAYHIFRRHFDRIPFQVNSDHAEYIGLFARTLLELGKERELEFYRNALERQYKVSKNPSIGYSLGYIYDTAQPKNPARAKGIFEQILKDPLANSFHVKTKILLTSLYYNEKNLTVCRALVDSIPPQADLKLQRTIEIWRGYIFQLEKRYPLAEALLENLVKKIPIEEDWYNYFSALNVLAIVYADQGKVVPARRLLFTLKKKFERCMFKTVQNQLIELERVVAAQDGSSTLILREEIDGISIEYGSRTHRMKETNSRNRLLLHLLKKRELDRGTIIRQAYGRTYQGITDNKLIYYQLHHIRKYLHSLGIPKKAITNMKDGYRLTSPVNWKDGSHEDL